MISENIAYKTNLQHLIDISIRLSSEKNADLLLEDILKVVMSIANCDAGSIYRVQADKRLQFSTVINKTLDIYLGGNSGEAVNFPYIDMFINGIENESAVVAHAANTGKEINIADVYDSQPFDMLAAKKMDKMTGYRTQSMLTFPLKDHTNGIIGVIQLINAKDSNNNTIPFNEDTATLIRSFTSLGAISLTNSGLVKEMEQLFLAFAKTIAKAIDMKSPHTGGHCKRVPALTLMIADQIDQADKGPLRGFKLSQSDRNQLDIAGWLHDCGKIATPDHIIDKSTKLQAVFDREQFIEAKFEILIRDIEIKYQTQIIKALQQGEPLVLTQIEHQKDRELKQIALDKALIKSVNVGTEYLVDEVVNQLQLIAQKYQISINGIEQPLLFDNELENLSVRKGTLTEQEREVIKQHMTITKDILDALPFPKHLQKVPEFALGHHEKLDGTGYPLGLTKEQMSVHARIMAVADIFEALSAADRPYKQAKPVSECLNILGKMVENNHLDPDIFAIFVESRIYEHYIREFASANQLDEVDFDNLPGYKPLEE